MIPYGRQNIDQDDIEAVVEVLRSDFLTTGPKVREFEQAVAEFVGSRYAVAVSSGTAALHAAMSAIGIGPGDEVIVPPITFAATANCIVYQGGSPVFVDVQPDTLLMDPERIEEKITERTKAVIAVDYAGHPFDYDAIRHICKKRGLILVADSCHALGAEYKGAKVGSLADMSVFSFHPVKHITSGEGGMIMTNNSELEGRLRSFRNHGISQNYKQREKENTWFYEIESIGFNYRITDFQSALGLSQLKKLPAWIARRQEIARAYDQVFEHIQTAAPLTVLPHVENAYHLYVIQLRHDLLSGGRNEIFKLFRANGLGVNVHYIPVHLHPFYRNQFGCKKGMCPVAEEAYEGILSLPIFPAMTDDALETCLKTVQKILS